MKGEGNQQDYGARVYDPRLGSFFSVDPMQKNFPEESPYGFAGNDPTFLVDHNGLFKISPYWARRYPSLAKVIQYYLPLLKDNKKVKEAWMETSGYTNKNREAGEKAFDKMVTFGEGPWVSPRRRSEEVHTGLNAALAGLLDNPDDGGQYEENYYPDNLFIGYTQIEEFELAVKKGDANAIAETMFFVTTAVMHESAHYGMFKFGKVESSDWLYEAGAMFEQKLFGERFSYRDPMSADREKNRRDKGVMKNWFEKNKKSTTSFGLSSSANFYNYYGMVKNAPVPQGQKRRQDGYWKLRC